MFLLNQERTLTTHASQRLNERTRISEEEFHSILYDKIVVCGVEARENKRHLLFFSPIDNTHFVAVEDYKYAVIITVLPLDYHENLAWRIAEKDLIKAQKLNPAQKELVLCSAKSIKVSILACPNMQSERISMGSYRFEIKPQSTTDVLYADGFINQLIVSIGRKGYVLDDFDEFLLCDKEGEVIQVLTWFEIDNLLDQALVS